MVDPTSRRWVIYSTFDPEGSLQSYALEQVIAYREAGSRVLVVDTSPALSAQRATAWRDHAAAWFQRENRGYDIMSYRAGLQWIRDRESDGSYSLLLTNDSCYGPFLPLGPILKELDQTNGPPTVFGVTDSWEIGYHLQSYWLYFPRGTVPFLADFFTGLGDILDRNDAINKGELALSRALLERGVVLKPFCSASDLFGRFRFFRWKLLAELIVRRLLKRSRYNWDLDVLCLNSLVPWRTQVPPLNQTLFAGVELFQRGLSPFVKRQFIRDRCFYRGPYSLSDTPSNEEVRAMLVAGARSHKFKSPPERDRAR